MTPQQIALVQASFAKVVPVAGTAADLFYQRLFELAPDVRPMFAADLSAQKKKLIDTLAYAVDSLRTPTSWGLSSRPWASATRTTVPRSSISPRSGKP